MRVSVCVRVCVVVLWVWVCMYVWHVVCAYVHLCVSYVYECARVVCACVWCVCMQHSIILFVDFFSLQMQ